MVVSLVLLTGSLWGGTRATGSIHLHVVGTRLDKHGQLLFLKSLAPTLLS